MKISFFLFIAIFLNACSFDNKTGIWTNDKKVSKKKESVFEDFKKISSIEKRFIKEKKLEKNFNFEITNKKNNFVWNDFFYEKNNNLTNFSYDGKNITKFKSKRITRFNASKYLLFENKSFVSSDSRGNLIIFSITEQNSIVKFNFYKKKYKNLKKKLNFGIEREVVYVTDNLGFVYAYNYKQNKILWAKDYKIPFRSNIKITDKLLIAADQNNSLYFFDKKNGNSLFIIPTEETIVKNEFINNISIDSEEQNLFYLNSYGSLYSINLKNFSTNWFINFNQSLDLNPSNLFTGSPVVNLMDYVIFSSNNETYILDKNNGSIISRNNFSTYLRPIIQNNYAFFVSKNNFLISLDVNSGSILYAHDILKKYSNFKNKNINNIKISNFMLIESKIIVFFENSKFLSFDINGNIIDEKKLKFKPATIPIIVNNDLVFLNQRNQLVIIN